MSLNVFGFRIVYTKNRHLTGSNDVQHLCTIKINKAFWVSFAQKIKLVSLVRPPTPGG